MPTWEWRDDEIRRVERLSKKDAEKGHYDLFYDSKIGSARSMTGRFAETGLSARCSNWLTAHAVPGFDRVITGRVCALDGMPVPAIVTIRVTDDREFRWE